MSWDARDIGDLTGRRAIVTGASSGLGRETVLELARHGASVVLAVRHLGKGEQALADLGGELAANQLPGLAPGPLELGRLDLADLASVRSFAGQWEGPLDLLVNNAGVMAIPYRQSPDGFELQLATNHLGPFALTGLLLAALRRTGSGAAPARVVTVSSQAHRRGHINLADLNGSEGYRKWGAYSQAKLANLLFTFELQRRLEDAGAPVRAYAAHPGLAATNLQQVGPDMAGNRLAGRAWGLGMALFGQSARMGALPSLFAATVPDLPGGSYVGPDGIGEQRGHPRLVGTSTRARDESMAKALWASSEELTGVHYDLAAPAGSPRP
jgi:NAD(P)-dependent dehydrogenase (short-subunit alcohol dehydrogenase family)